MRKTILFISLLIALPLVAADRGRGAGNSDYHFGYISASAGYSSLSQDVENVTTKGNWASLFGAGYEFRMNSGWVSIGVQFQQEQSTTMPKEYIYTTPFGGKDGSMEFNNYQYTIRQTDKQVWRTIDIPLMAGYYKAGFYIGAGAKVGFSVGSSITTSGEYDLSGNMTKYSGSFDYGTFSVADQKYDCALRPQFSVIGEIGYDLLSSMMSNSVVCHMLNIGIYAEYGLRSVRPTSSIDPIQIQNMSITEAAKAEADVRQAHMTPYYLSTQTEGKRIVPFYVGVKLTYLIGSGWNSAKTWHKGCQCYQ